MPYRMNDDGTATPVAWTPETEAAINEGRGKFYPTVVGAVRHGGVKASAVRITAVQTYDAARWLATGEMVPAGTVTSVEREMV